MNLALTQMAQKKIESAVKALKANRFDARFVPNREELLKILDEMIPENAVVANGGSVTLSETGVMDFLRSGKFQYLDRYREGMTAEERREIFLRSLDCDWYFTSSNAITMDGQLYNIDGNSNRIAAIAYGPRNVVVIAGVNKLVQNLAEAESRVKNWVRCCQLLPPECPHHRLFHHGPMHRLQKSGPHVLQYAHQQLSARTRQGKSLPSA
jgi:hypothetical protein